MASASKIMYTIGRIFNIIAIIGTLIILILGIVCLAAPGKFVGTGEDFTDENAVMAYGLILAVTGGILLVVYSIICALAGHARRALNNGRKDNAPHIMMIIVGVFGDIFYLLGGIFGLVAESQEGKE